VDELSESIFQNLNHQLKSNKSLEPTIEFVKSLSNIPEVAIAV
jgi:hypothetical protein